MEPILHPLRDIFPAILFSGTYLPDKSTDSEQLFEPLWGFPGWLDGAVAKRRIEYRAGRWCARDAMRRLGFAPVAIARDPAGRPDWPAGVTGSITHSDTIAVAAVARSSEIAALGIDCEALLAPAVAGEIAATVACAGEIARIAATGMRDATAVSLIFSAKEALYKCLNPIVGRFFDHHAAELIAADPVARTFEIRLRVDLNPRFPAGRVFVGRFDFADRHVHTLVAIAR